MKNKIKNTILFDMYQHVRYQISKFKINKNNINVAKERYRIVTKKELNIDRPISLSDKLNVYKIFYRDSLLTKCSDKYLVREYVEEKIGKKYLNGLLGVYEKFEDINFEKLPKEFALKVNHSSARQLLCIDKSSINKRLNKFRFNIWQKQNYYYWSGEWGYKDISPRIIAEEYLGNNIVDYKFYVFNGVPLFLYVAQGLTYEKTLKIAFYDMDFNLEKFQRNDYPLLDKMEKPSNFEEMKIVATKLAEPFPFVRVDLFEVDSKIIFSELTFYPASGIQEFEPEEYNKYFGDRLDITLDSNFKSV